MAKKKMTQAEGMGTPITRQIDGQLNKPRGTASLPFGPSTGVLSCAQATASDGGTEADRPLASGRETGSR